MQVSALEVRAKGDGRVGLQRVSAVMESNELVVSDAAGYVSYDD